MTTETTMLDFLLVDDEPITDGDGLAWLEQAEVGVPPELMEQEENDDKARGPDVRVVDADGQRVAATQEQRLAFCGALCHKADVKTGRRVGFFFKCGLHLLCDRCAARRAEQEAARVMAALDGSPAWKLVVPPDGDAVKAVRALAATDYRRYPLEDGSTLILHRDPDGGGEPVDVVEDLPWEEMMATPPGSNVSGKMKRDAVPPSKDNDAEKGESRRVRVPAVSFADRLDRPDYEQKEDAARAWEFAILATAHIPADLSTLYMLLPELMRHYQSAMANLGYDVIFFVYEWQRVREDEVDWEPYRSHIRKKLQAQGYTNVALDPPEAEWDD